MTRHGSQSGVDLKSTYKGKPIGTCKMTGKLVIPNTKQTWKCGKKGSFKLTGFGKTGAANDSKGTWKITRARAPASSRASRARARSAASSRPASSSTRARSSTDPCSSDAQPACWPPADAVARRRRLRRRQRRHHSAVAATPQPAVGRPPPPSRSPPAAACSPRRCRPIRVVAQFDPDQQKAIARLHELPGLDARGPRERLEGLEAHAPGAVRVAIIVGPARANDFKVPDHATS